ncbi:hypothetical protein DesfrDRAFT_0331 [Solidesulfovibrio fructosivorans JJ]]|uniref:Uncharacterized protein n=1 Tax=Solidesulfovibrio fructosivorans JJ] TaxID=596151 RepID=E1JRT2_SOLFR|nr:hypothetical protein [Solidesulfovibrio fructosivorans]EFL52701.1 hypothetical protein DesfrDRAFT_0331 [Solidesulfovibrio fructosivorans JJ]]
MNIAHRGRLAILLAAILLSLGLRPVCAAERPAFSVDEPGDATYKQHIVALWEKTKPVLREDLAANLSDAEYLRLGKPMRAAWVNLQVHASLRHAGKRDSGVEDTKDHTFADLVGKIIELVDDVYGWPPDTPREREDKRQAMRKSRLEHKIKRFDAVLRSVNVN